MFEEELAEALGRGRYARGGKAKGYRNGHRDRELVGTFGRETVRVPRARIEGEDGSAHEWRSKALPRYQRLTKKAEALIASVYLSGTNTRRVKRALFALFEGAVSKDVVSRAWRKVKVDWDAWCARSLTDEDFVRLILDGTVVRTRIDKRATNVSVLAAIGVRRDGQKVLLAIRNMGGESTAAWSSFLGDLDARGLRRPEFVIVDGAPGLEAALAQLWGEDLPIQRCTVHKHRNLLAHAPRLVGISRSSLSYQARPDRHARLRERLITLSGKHRRYGYRMLHAKLVREGFRVNVKVVERIYREERLWLRRLRRKKIPREAREGSWCPIAANQRWSLDFTGDALANGRKFRTANLKDDCTRECPAIEVDFSLPGDRVVDMLERVARERGYPDILVVDNGPELRGRALDR